jgi:hypothetical protein
LQAQGKGAELQGRGGSTESRPLARLGVESDGGELEEQTTLYNHVLISVPVLRVNTETMCMCMHACA